jgi:hypothetical protein
MRVDDDVVFGQQARQVGVIDERRHLGGEVLDADWLRVAQRVVLRRALESALDGIGAGGISSTLPSFNCSTKNGW